jgi:hypothetical protein
VAAQVIAIVGLALPEITGIVQFNMEIGDLTSHPEGIQFPFCVPVAAGIGFVFMAKP